MKPRPAPARADDAVSMDFDDEALLYQLRTGEVRWLDRIGALVWQLLDGETTVDELVADLAAAFEVGEDGVRSDVEALLDGLAQASLLASDSAPPPPAQPRQLTNPPSP